jgi:hypothetical protein
MTATPPEELAAAEVSVRTFSTTAATVAEPVAAGDQIVYTYEKKDATGKVVDTRKVAFRAPDTNILVMMIARLENSTNLELAGSSINMFMSMVIDEDDVRYFTRRLFDPKDPFSSADIADTLSAIVEDWGDRPTGPASASSGSPSGRGKTSKAKRHGHGSNRGNGRSPSGSPSSTPSSVDA